MSVLCFNSCNHSHHVGACIATFPLSKSVPATSSYYVRKSWAGVHEMFRARAVVAVQCCVVQYLRRASTEWNIHSQTTHRQRSANGWQLRRPLCPSNTRQSTHLIPEIGQSYRRRTNEVVKLLNDSKSLMTTIGRDLKVTESR